MTDCTERRPPVVGDGRDREGHEGMSKVALDMTDCTERRPPVVGDGRDREGHEGMSKVAQ